MDNQGTTNPTEFDTDDKTIEASEMSQPDLDAGVQFESKEVTTKTSKEPDKYYYWKSLCFVVSLGVTAFLFLLIYMRVHGINAVEAFNDPNYVWIFDFVGGSRNPASIGFEIGIWTFLGVTCKVAYTSTKTILRRQFDWLKYLIGWIGAGLYAWGIAVAVIFSLQVITLNIGGVEITLANISIEGIIAISFVLGFYNDEARRLLDNIRGQIVQGMSKTEENGEK
jgi:hypothetical protein